MASKAENNNQHQQSQHSALDAIASYVKLEVTLAAGGIALSATFLDSVYRGHSIWSLIVAWSLLGLSIIFGFLVHGEYITRLVNDNVKVRRGERIEILALCQTVCLFTAFAFFAAFAITNVTVNPLPTN